jgi:alpha-L-rhamnosidase
MKKALAHLDDTGQFKSGATAAWKFLDRSDSLETGAEMHGLVLFCCKEINKLAAIIEKPVPFTEVVVKMTAAASSIYGKSVGVFVSGSTRQVSWSS